MAASTSEELQAEIVAYADDFVILTRRFPEQGLAKQARDWTQRVMSRIGLTLNEQKTSIRDSRNEDFDFLGYTFGPRYWWKQGQLCPSEMSPWPEVRDRLNAKMRGWHNYFRYGTVARTYLRRRHINIAAHNPMCTVLNAIDSVCALCEVCRKAGCWKSARPV